MKEQCKAAVAKALGKASLNQQEAQKIDQRVIDAKKALAKKDRQAWHNLSESEKLIQASEFVAQDIQAQLKRKHKIAAQDILTQSKGFAVLDDTSINLSAAEKVDRMIAAHGDMSGIQSIDTWAKSIASIQHGELTKFYANIKGGMGIFTDKDLVQKIIRERFGVNTGDSVAKSISDKLGNVFENMRERFNRSGGDIGKLDNWGLPQTHSLEKIIKVGKEAWVSKAEQLIDTKQYVHEDGSYYSQKEIRDLLEYSYDSITTNGANKTEIGRQSYGGGSKVTSRHSESRVLHFKDADAWMEYQSEFGGMPFTDLVESHINGLSKDIALVEKLGSNPKGAMRILMDAARKKDAEKGFDHAKTKKTLKRAQTMFDEIMGENSPQSEVLANLGIAYRSMNVGAMLGGTTLSSVTDQAMIKKTANIHGIAWRKVFGEQMSQLNPKNKEDREFAHSLGLATEEMLGSINRWSDDGLTSVHGKSQKLAKASNAIATQVMRVSGLNALTAASKVGFTKLLMEKYGRLSRDKSWSDLKDIDREMMSKTGLSERAWEVMRLADPVVDRKGNQLMSARSIYEIPNEKLLAAMDSDVKALVDNIDGQIKELDNRNVLDDQRIINKMQKTDDIKRQLSKRLLDYANKKDTNAQTEKQALQNRIDLIEAQKEAVAAQADMNAYIKALENQDELKGFIDGITQGKTIDNLTEKAKKLGRTLEELDNKVLLKTTKLNDKIKTFEKDIQGKFVEFNELLKGKVKLSKEKLAKYEDRLSDRLNRYASRRDVIAQKEVDTLNDLKELISVKKEQIETDFEIRKAVVQTRIKGKTDKKIDSSISRNARKNYKSGEDLGYRLGNAERRITELRAKMRNTDSTANKSISEKFKELDKKVRDIDVEFLEYQTRVSERQARRDHVSNTLFKSIDGEKKLLAQKIKDEIASQFQAHLLDEQGMAVLEAGLRERTWMSAGQSKGSGMGEIVKSMLQFKSFSASFLMRHGSRAMSQPTLQGKAKYAASLIAMTTLLGGLVVQLKELANGNDPSTMWDSEDPKKTVDFFKRAFAAGGGLPVLGDILVAGMDPSGRDAGDFVAGPLGSDFTTVLALTIGNATQAANGIETNAGNEAFKFVKNKIPGQNLWYTKAATNRLIFNEIQDIIAPGYREKLQRKAERQFGRTQWLGDFHWGSGFEHVDAPDFEKVIE
ncbi:hypothetical protein B9T31_16055 [Acinetobacter sp. ANC 4558]|uniref:hypothetical protein n=1 Tax=Acinetobacter sp. ANC 4558 TaxID=1977876 RepID=UPI000A346E52|nr:hypothetical protein [Acinetobacter sp. ANC 4558]OTG80811.1 hypothetical protein B9T31_16055 [Acinetobacter sp. ANC 4558]